MLSKIFLLVIILYLIIGLGLSLIVNKTLPKGIKDSTASMIFHIVLWLWPVFVLKTILLFIKCVIIVAHGVTKENENDKEK